MAQINQLPRRRFEGVSEEFNQHYNQLIDTVNSLAGYNGIIEVKNHLNLGGNRVMNVAQPASSTDVVNLTAANANYSAAALRPQLEANGSQPLQTPRRLNDQVQREQYSSFLNEVLSTAPSANNIQILFSTPGAGMTTISLPASIFKFADGTTFPLNALSVTVNNPALFTIVASPTGAVSNGTSATILTTASTGVVPGNFVSISGVTDPNFDGEWEVVTVGVNQFTFATTIPASNSGGGTVATAGVYYFYAVKGNHNPQFIGVAATADSPFNRLPTSIDGQQLIAIATVTGTGGVSTSSAGGGTPASTLNAGSFF